MTLTKNQWIIVGVVALIVIWYFFIRKKPTTESESGYMTVGGKPYGSNCNCQKRLADRTMAYGRTVGGVCNWYTDCFPPTKTLK